MATVFEYIKGIIPIDYIKKGSTSMVLQDKLISTFERRTKKKYTENKNVLFQYDSAPSHSPAVAMA